MVKLSTSTAGLLSTVFFNSAAQAQLANAPRRLLRISKSAASSTSAENDTSSTKDEVTRQLQKEMTTFNIAGSDPEEIINGEELPRGLYPFLVELRLQSPSYYNYGNGRSFQHFCGGTLIGRQTVLTAAHCFTDGGGNFMNTINQVDIGRYELEDDAGVTSFQICRKEYGIGCDKSTTAFVVRKQDYNGRNPNFYGPPVVTDNNDFTLVFLPQPITDIDPVELNDDPNIPANAGDEVTVIGWGNTITDSDYQQAPNRPRQTVTYEYVSNAQCDIDWYPQLVTSSNQMCAYGELELLDKPNEKMGTCQGDSGGPLLLDRLDGTSVQVGLLSSGSLGCGELNVPDVFARVSAQINWITDTACDEVGDLCPAVSPTVSPSKDKPDSKANKKSKADKTPKKPKADKTGQQSDSASQIIMPFPYSELSDSSLSMSMW